MSRSISSQLKDAMYAQETDDVFTLLLTIDHPDLAQPIRVCLNGEDITSRGNLFVYYPFEIVLPQEEEKGVPHASISIDNVSVEISRTIRQINEAPTVLIEGIRTEDPDVVELSLPSFILANAKGDEGMISGELVLEDLSREPFPVGTFNPARFRGLF